MFKMKRYQLNALCLFLVAACYICHIEAQECDRNVGPAGTVHCIKILRYNNDYQWATCRTNEYIQTKSKGGHICEDRSATYCYYQCMIDVYDKNDGIVLPHCKCSPGDPVPTEGVILPEWCYSPDGTNCNWYRECLNKAYPACEGHEDDYAIGFADKFCNLYNKNYKDFSLQGQQWVAAVRKCLQLELVPLIDRTRAKTCAELKSIAFKTHTPCYLNPDQSSLSFCGLSMGDQMTVFLTIKSAYIDAFSSSLKGMLDMMVGCTKAAVQAYVEKVQEVKAKIEKAVDAIIDRTIHKIKKTIEDVLEDVLRETAERIKTWLKEQLLPSPIQFDLFIEIDDLFKLFNRKKLFKRKRRSISDDQEIERSQLAGKIVDALALEQGWQEKGVAWFAYANNDTTNDNDTMSIRFLVADRFKYEGVDNTTLFLTKPANLTETLVQLSEAVLKGTLNLQIDGEDVEIMKLNGCLDWDCEVHAFNITSFKSPNINTEAYSTEAFTLPPLQTQKTPCSNPYNGTNCKNAVELPRAMHTLAYFVILVISYIFVS